MSTSSKYSASDAMTAAILARVICPDNADWSAQVSRELLKLQFSVEDAAQFHQLLARQFAGSLTETEQKLLNNYLFVNSLVMMIHERAKGSLGKAKTSQTSRPNPAI